MTTTSEPSGVLVVDKATGPTSHDVVAIARGALGTRAIGHTGTLDPMASGVLVLVVGEATKLVSSLTALQKRYDATIKLGVATSTLDAQGEIEAQAPVPALDRSQVEAALTAFLGVQDQRAPLVSAIKRDGQPLYKRARSGAPVEVPVRRVRLDEVVVHRAEGDEIALSVACGSGFYVRALARDLAAALGTVGHLTSLRRTHNGRFDLTQAVSFDALRAGRGDEGRRAAMRARVLPLQQVCLGLPHLALDDAGVDHARHGRPIPLLHVASGTPPVAAGSASEGGGSVIALDLAGRPVALVTSSLDHLRVVRGFRTG